MNIDVVGRVRPSIRGEGPVSLIIENENQVATQSGGTLFDFQMLHKQKASNFDVFKQSVEPLVELLVAGFNTCLVVTGQSGSGKSFTVAGETTTNTGMVPMILENLFARIGEDDNYIYDSHANPQRAVTLQVYEIYNELIKDLLKVPDINKEYLSTDDLPNVGPHVKDVTTANLKRASDGVSQFRQAFGRRTETYTDFGLARNHAAIVVHIGLIMQDPNSRLPNKSRLTVVLTPGAEKLADDVSQLRVREGPTLSKSMICLAQLAANLASKPYPDRAISYGDSKLTYLLQDELGGNCKTRVLVCLKPQTDKSILGPILHTAKHFSQVKNFPLLNDPLAQQLVCQYRARILSLQQDIGQDIGMAKTSHLLNPNEELRRMQTENLQLRDKNERLHQKLEQLQGRFGDIATTKTDLSAQLLMTEEEKLKVSKTLVEMQIENNRLKEEAEQVKFELTNKVLQLESELVEMEMDRDKHMKVARNNWEKLSELQKDRKELADEYVVLKTNFLNLQKAHEAEALRNEELSMELLRLANAKAAVMKNYGKRDMEIEASQEVERARAIISRLNSRKLQPDDLTRGRTDVEKNLFGSQHKFDTEMGRLKNMYDDDRRKLEQRMTNAQRDLQEARTLVREKQRKISELNAKMLSQKSLVQQLQSENNRMQHKVKDINDEFKSRLIRYLEDVAGYIDTGGMPGSKKSNQDMRKYVESMLKDMKKSHKVREEQLSQAARNYKQMVDKTVQKHEQLLVAYRDLRQQIEEQRIQGVVLGPDESELQMSDSQLISDQQKAINKLQDQLNRLQANIPRGRSEKQKPSFNDGREASDSEDWGSLRKQLREFTVNTQQKLELERAGLMTENAMLQEEVKGLQEYIDNHLSRYRDEIVRLREGQDTDMGGFISPSGPPRYGDRHKKHRR